MAYLFTRSKLKIGFYHVYNRGRNGLALFRDDHDRRHFEALINRHLSDVPHFDRRGRPYACLRSEVRMIARNLLTTHFHLILWQKVPGGLENLMSRVMPTYTLYYHRKYGTSGTLYAGEYRAKRVLGSGQLRWLIGYVHGNHARLGLDWPFSTHRLFLDADDAPSWIETAVALRHFGGRQGYLDYLARRDLRSALDRELRHERPEFEALGAPRPRLRDGGVEGRTPGLRLRDGGVEGRTPGLRLRDGGVE